MDASPLANLCPQVFSDAARDGSAGNVHVGGCVALVAGPPTDLVGYGILRGGGGGKERGEVEAPLGGGGGLHARRGDLAVWPDQQLQLLPRGPLSRGFEPSP